MDLIKIILQYLLPKRLLSRFMGYLAQARAGWLTHKVITWFIEFYQVDMSLAQQPDPKMYASFNDFFTRALKSEARPIDTTAAHIISPVDGTISALGDINGTTLIQAKGKSFSLSALLAGSQELSEQFTHGKFATIYLSPKDYHRIHMPIKGTLTQMIHVPGQLFSVNPNTVNHIDQLFARNERVITLFDSEIGPFALILVGATIVGSIETVWSGTVTPPTNTPTQWSYHNQQKVITLDKGDEMGRFKLGSTVILLFPKQSVDFIDNFQNQVPTIMGQALAKITS